MDLEEINNSNATTAGCRISVEVEGGDRGMFF